MENNFIPFNDILEEMRQSDPDNYNRLMDECAIESDLFNHYKEKANIPEFTDIDEYAKWLETSAGKKHIKALKKIEKEAESIIIKKHGGYRAGAGRKKSEEKKVKITKQIPKKTKDILEVFAKKNNLSENEVINNLIIKFCGEKPELYFN